MADAIRHLEHISLRAWPALETQLYDGWLLRFSNGYTGRANSVNPFDGSSLSLDEKIAYCENLYAKRQLDMRFRMNEAVFPSELDATLAQHGYDYFSETHVLVCDLAQHPPMTDTRFQFTEKFTEKWLAAYTSMNDTAPRHIPTLHAMLQNIESDTCFGSMMGDAAVGLAVRKDNFVGLFDIVVDASQRRQGLGKGLVSSLMAWGLSQGASSAYLQVVAENAPAQTLYAHLGFALHHKYWYRIKCYKVL
ncbi:MAG: GNAT family N-acetyltransferase [Anaerolineae bacterium]|nr:GNAT family N-acetyltransferase [Anaerolineae bacterium]